MVSGSTAPETLRATDVVCHPDFAARTRPGAESAQAGDAAPKFQQAPASLPICRGVVGQYLNVGGTGDDDTLARLRQALAADGTAGGIAASDLVWLGRNVDRIDVRLRDADGREHHVVATEDHPGLSIVLVFSEPAQVPVQAPVVVVVNGPSGSGKSTLLRSIAEVSEVPWVTFDEPILGTTDQPLLVWPERSPQLHDGFLDGIVAVAAAGNAVAVAAAGHGQDRFRALMREVRRAVRRPGLPNRRPPRA